MRQADQAIPRRMFLQGFFGTIFLPFLVKPGATTPSYDGLVYSDGENTDPALLVALGDLIVDSGGVEYAA